MESIEWIVGIDPGLAHLGLAYVCVVYLEQPRRIEFGVGVVSVAETQHVYSPRGEPAAEPVDEELHRRALELRGLIEHHIERGQVVLSRSGVGIQYRIAVEGMSFPRSSTAAVKLGAANAVVSMVFRARESVRIAPREVRQHLGVPSGAAWSEVEATVARLLPRHLWCGGLHLPWSSCLTCHLKPLKKPVREHAVDAIAVAMALAISEAGPGRPAEIEGAPCWVLADAG